MTVHRPPGFKRILARELRQISTRPALAFMLAPMPLIIFLLLGAVFAEGLPRNLPVAVVDLDGSTLSRQIVRMVDATADVKVAEQLPTLTEARRSLVRRHTYAILLIPRDMQRNLEVGQSPEVVIFSNNQFMTAGGIAAQSMTTAVSTFAAGATLRTLQARGVSQEQGLDWLTPIPVQQSPLFNPSLDYIQFLLSAVLPSIMQIFVCATAVLSFSREHHSESGIPRLMRLAGTPGKAVLGKLLPYTIIATIVLLFGDILLFRFFGANFRGNVWVFFLNGLLFVIASQFLGAFLALLSKDTTSALGAMGLIAAPAFGFAGVSFPRLAMNTFSQVWGSIIPLTPYLELRTDQTLRGTPLEYSLPTMLWLFVLVLFYGVLLMLMLRKEAKVAPPVASEVAT